MLVPGTTELVPLCRPISLKNESIDIVRGYEDPAKQYCRYGEPDGVSDAVIVHFTLQDGGVNTGLDLIFNTESKVYNVSIN